MKLTRNAWTAYVIAVVVLILDQLSKFYIMNVLRLPEQVPHEVLWPLQWHRIWNQGVSFGLLQAGTPLFRWGLVAFSVLIAGLLISWARTQARALAAVGLGLIIGGAIGNAIDRARYGAVVDFIDVQRLGFFPWIFNVADSGITIGVILLLLDSLRRDRASDDVGSPG